MAPSRAQLADRVAVGVGEGDELNAHSGNHVVPRIARHAHHLAARPDLPPRKGQAASAPSGSVAGAVSVAQRTSRSGPPCNRSTVSDGKLRGAVTVAEKGPTSLPPSPAT